MYHHIATAAGITSCSISISLICCNIAVLPVVNNSTPSCEHYLRVFVHNQPNQWNVSIMYLRVFVGVVHADNESMSVDACRFGRTELDREYLMTVHSDHAQRRLYCKHSTHMHTHRTDL